MAGGQDKSVSIEPVRIGRIVLKKSGPQHIRHRGGAQRQARVAALGFFHRIHRQEPDRIDRQLIQLRRAKTYFTYATHRRFLWLAPDVCAALMNWFEVKPSVSSVYSTRHSFVAYFPTASGILGVIILQASALPEPPVLPPVHDQLPQSAIFRTPVDSPLA